MTTRKKKKTRSKREGLSPQDFVTAEHLHRGVVLAIMASTGCSWSYALKKLDEALDRWERGIASETDDDQ